MTILKNKVSTTVFYDRIADQYDSQQRTSDKDIRTKVATEFKNTIKGANVLDFGGGTGLDLKWLTDSYKVYFLEPSVNMRSHAMNSVPVNDNIIFVAQHTDINTWNENKLPFDEKVDGVLMNFAVLNCIKNIDTLFSKLAMVCNKNAYLFALILDQDRIEISQVKKLFYSAFNRATLIYNNDKGIRHKTYLHTKKQILSACVPHFDCVSCNPIEFSNFDLLILAKK